MSTEGKRRVSFMDGGVTDPTAQLRQGDIEALIELVTVPTFTLCAPCPGKACRSKMTGGYSLATYRGNRRNNDNVIENSGLIFDEDHGSRARLERSVELLKADGLTFAFGPTHSSTDAAPKARLWIDVDRPIKPPEFPRVWAAVDQRYELGADRHASDPGHFYYRPTLVQGGTPFVVVNRGRPLSVAEAMTWPVDLPSETRKTLSGTEWLDVIGSLKEGGRDNGLTRLAGVLFRSLPPRLAEAMVHATNRAFCSPPLPDAQVSKICGSIARREVRR